MSILDDDLPISSSIAFPPPRIRGATCFLDDGSAVLLVGGRAPQKSAFFRDVYVLKNGSWTLLTCSGDGPAARYGHTLTPVTISGRQFVILIGGASAQTANALGVQSKSVDAASPLNESKVAAAAAAAAAASSAEDADCFALDVKAMHWQRLSSSNSDEAPEGRYYHSATLFPPLGGIVLIGGRTISDGSLVDDVVALRVFERNPSHPEAQRLRESLGSSAVSLVCSWQRPALLAGSPPTPRYHHCAFAVNQRHLYVYGGIAQQHSLANNLHSYSAKTQIWSQHSLSGGGGFQSSAPSSSSSSSASSFRSSLTSSTGTAASGSAVSTEDLAISVYVPNGTTGGFLVELHLLKNSTQSFVRLLQLRAGSSTPSKWLSNVSLRNSQLLPPSQFYSIATPELSSPALASSSVALLRFFKDSAPVVCISVENAASSTPCVLLSPSNIAESVNSSGANRLLTSSSSSLLPETPNRREITLSSLSEASLPLDSGGRWALIELVLGDSLAPCARVLFEHSAHLDDLISLAHRQQLPNPILLVFDAKLGAWQALTDDASLQSAIARAPQSSLGDLLPSLTVEPLRVYAVQGSNRVAATISMLGSSSGITPTNNASWHSDSSGSNHNAALSLSDPMSGSGARRSEQKTLTNRQMQLRFLSKQTSRFTTRPMNRRHVSVVPEDDDVDGDLDGVGDDGGDGFDLDPRAPASAFYSSSAVGPPPSASSSSSFPNSSYHHHYASSAGSNSDLSGLLLGASSSMNNLAEVTEGEADDLESLPLLAQHRPTALSGIHSFFIRAESLGLEGALVGVVQQRRIRNRRFTSGSSSSVANGSSSAASLLDEQALFGSDRSSRPALAVFCIALFSYLLLPLSIIVVFVRRPLTCRARALLLLGAGTMLLCLGLPPFLLAYRSQLANLCTPTVILWSAGMYLALSLMAASLDASASADSGRAHSLSQYKVLVSQRVVEKGRFVTRNRVTNAGELFDCISSAESSSVASVSQVSLWPIVLGAFVLGALHVALGFAYLVAVDKLFAAEVAFSLEEQILACLPLFASGVGAVILYFVLGLSTAAFIRQRQVVRLFSAMSSRSASSKLDLPFLPLQHPENVVAWLRLRSQVVDLHRNLPIVAANVTMGWATILGLGLLVAFTIVTFTSSRREDLITASNIFVAFHMLCVVIFCLRGLALCLAINGETRSHVVILNKERLRLHLEVEALRAMESASAAVASAEGTALADGVTGGASNSSSHSSANVRGSSASSQLLQHGFHSGGLDDLVSVSQMLGIVKDIITAEQSFKVFGVGIGEGLSRSLLGITFPLVAALLGKFVVDLSSS